jgi:hypothetical protein
MKARTQTKVVGTDGDTQLKAWSLFCQSLFASNEFIYLR